MANRFRSTQEWSNVVEDWRFTGLSVKEFCQQEGISESRFYEMRKQLATGINRRTKKKSEKKAQQFVPVQIKPVPELLADQKPLGYLEIVTPTGHMVRIH